MSDLIERLRVMAGESLSHEPHALVNEAADEIERLERAVDQEKLVHLDFIGELQEKIERLEGALQAANEQLNILTKDCKPAISPTQEEDDGN